MIEQAGVTRAGLRFRTHALLRAAGGIMPLVLQQFVGKDAKEFPLGELFGLLEPPTQRTCQRVALHLPKLCHLDARGVHLQRGSHR